ncbi:hypothetical protein [Sagittula stellata]|uniref:Uncharacterized protein n=1 Tax=Sagittula stellata (strain ATCC 700073 / DSM 11524 / E-37) TaxID=388399 RepID=A3K862_SAGS3|nr:hypothetical protein [Sagittula stellata]EBA06541.1 hypothetical protein SSE37_09808 [Sagittula stellata E-37]
MPLFNPKTIARHAKDVEIPETHLKHLQEWRDMIEDGRIGGLKETALHGQFSTKIVEGVLGYTGPASGSNYTVASEKSILRGSVDLPLGHFSEKSNEIIAPFELKGAKTHDLDAIMPGRNKSPVQRVNQPASSLCAGPPGRSSVCGCARPADIKSAVRTAHHDLAPNDIGRA